MPVGAVGFSLLQNVHTSYGGSDSLLGINRPVREVVSFPNA